MHFAIKICVLILWIFGITLDGFSQTPIKFNYKKKNTKFVGDVTYSIKVVKDGKEEVIETYHPKLDFSGVKDAKILVEFKNLEWNKRKQRDYQLRVVAPTKVKGLSYINTSPKRYLQKGSDVISVIYQVVDNTNVSSLNIALEVFSEEGEKLGSKALKQQNFTFTGLGPSAEEKLKLKPQVKFVSSTVNVTEGSVIHFYDESSNNPTKWIWTFEGGFPNQSAKQNPTVTYRNAGTYLVGLRVSNAYGESERNIESYVVVTGSKSDNTVVSTDIIADEENVEEEVVSPEDSIWNHTLEKDSLPVYLEFLDLFPDGENASTARQRVLELQPIDASVTQHENTFDIELFYARSPISYEVVQGNEQNLQILIQEDKNKILVKVKDQKQHLIRIEDARGKIKEIFVDGGIPELKAQFDYLEEQVVVKISGGQTPYFVDFKKDGLVHSYPVNDSSKITFSFSQLVKDGLIGEYEIEVKDNRKTIIASNTGKYKNIQKAKTPLPLWAFLSFPLVFLIGWLIYKNR